MAGRAGAVSARACRGCAAVLDGPFLDLGAQPLANAFLRPEDGGRPEVRVPLAVAYCARCHLVQLTETAPPEALFTEGEQSAEFQRTVSRLHEMRSAEYLGCERRRSGAKVQSLQAD